MRVLPQERRVEMIYRMSEKAYYNFIHDDKGRQTKNEEDVIKVINNQYGLKGKVTSISIK